MPDVQTFGDAGDGGSGNKLINNGVEALSARVTFAAKADVSLDAKHHLLPNDPSGIFFARRPLDSENPGWSVKQLLNDTDISNYRAMQWQ